MTTFFLKKATGFMAMALLLSVTVQAQTVQTFIDHANMDMTVKPGDDFYTYANGNWVKNNPIPAKETRWGSFNVLRDFNINAVKTILQKAAADKNAKPGSVEKRVGDFYIAAMDSAAIEKLGYTPIKSNLARINNLKTTNDVLNEMTYLRKNSVGSPLFSFYISQDRKNVEQMIVQLGQGGTTMPDRDYYLKDDKRYVEARQAYTTYIEKLFTLTGTPAAQATKDAATILRIEKQLAAAQLPRVEMRDPDKTYNKFFVNDLSKTTSNINWLLMLSNLGVTGQDSVIVNNPEFFKAINGMLTAIPLNDWKAYLKWTVLKDAAPYLSKPFVDANFAYSQVLSGQKEQTPRWQRMSSLTDGSIGELLGQLYVKDYFKPAAKARMDELVKNLRKAYAIRINGLDWMSEDTKKKALAKLAAFNPKIGYPDKWQNYDGLVINSNTFFKNVENAGKWRYNFMLSQLGKPVDRTRFGMTPPKVNAYYNATLNEIVFPAGILQFPFFDADADDAVNYGGIGAVIGHEMSHGFDDQGSKFDADGTMRNWWTAEDRKKFDEKVQALARQFDAYTVLDTLHVNGKFTSGENIGDLGGLNAAYEAFKMTDQWKKGEKIDGLTPDQRFFLAWAQVWRMNILPQTAAQLIVTDPHSPGQYRTIGPIVNMDAWYNAFDVKPGDKLYKTPQDRIRMW